MTTKAIADLEQGRKSYREQAWQRAFESLAEADRVKALAADDLELLARAAYMIGRDADYVGSLERAHQAYLARSDLPRAARCAFWIGHNLVFSGERALGTGWFARAQRLLESEDDCVERGYLRAPARLAPQRLDEQVMLEQVGANGLDRAAGAVVRFREIDHPAPAFPQRRQQAIPSDCLTRHPQTTYGGTRSPGRGNRFGRHSKQDHQDGGAAPESPSTGRPTSTSSSTKSSPERLMRAWAADTPGAASAHLSRIA